jgi:hypothetical protein
MIIAALKAFLSEAMYVPKSAVSTILWKNNRNAKKPLLLLCATAFS